MALAAAGGRRRQLTVARQRTNPNANYTISKKKMKRLGVTPPPKASSQMMCAWPARAGRPPLHPQLTPRDTHRAVEAPPGAGETSEAMQAELEPTGKGTTLGAPPTW